MQLAAYNAALGGERRLVNVFIDRTEPGKIVLHEWTPEEADKALIQFNLLVQLWQITKDYYPASGTDSTQSGNSNVL